ncbi:MATE family efflux transporter [Algimonas porphyrae]|nr:MATE family efflux transporter [Algimonas porphyrae]
MTVNAIPNALPRTWRGEMIALLVLGGPMALTQIIQFSIYTIDTIMIGRVGTDALAAAAIGTVIYFLLWMIGAGPVSAVTPMVSQSIGTTIGKPGLDARRDARRSVRMALWLVTLLTVPMFGFLLFAEDVLIFFGQDPEISRMAQDYVLVLAPGLPFALGVMVLRNFLATLNKTMVPLVLVTFSVLINAGLNAVLIFGLLGAPALGLIGAGIASSISYCLCFVMMASYVSLDRDGRQFDVFRNLLTFDRDRFGELVRLSWPISVTTLFEGMLFNAAALVMGAIGVHQLAAYQVALNVAAMAFMLPWGLAMAGATRIGLAEGAGDAEARQRAAQTTMVAAVGGMAVIALLVTLLPTQIAHIYMRPNDPENAATIAFILTFLPIAAAFMIFDATQLVANQLLRGLKDVTAPMIITGVSFWVIGFPLCYYLGFYTEFGPNGVWYGLMSGLMAAFIGLGIRLLQRLRVPPRPPELRQPDQDSPDLNPA